MIYGTGLRLRAIEKSDIPRFVDWLNDPEVLKGLLIYAPLSHIQEEKWFENTLQRPIEEQPLVIEIQNQEGWQPIGNIGLNSVNWRERKAEVGIFIGDKKYWSHGYGREAMVTIIKYAFDTLNLNRVFLRVHETNRRAIRSYEHAGFVHEGRLRQDHFANGEYIDVLIMSVLRSEWQGSPQG